MDYLISRGPPEENPNETQPPLSERIEKAIRPASHRKQGVVTVNIWDARRWLKQAKELEEQVKELT